MVSSMHTWPHYCELRDSRGSCILLLVFSLCAWISRLPASNPIINKYANLSRGSGICGMMVRSRPVS